MGNHSTYSKESLQSQSAQTSYSKICPYTGLRSFSPEESLYFRGREVHVEKVVELLQEKKFLMLTGASGDGKSSLVYAGLIPNLKAGFIKAKFSNWVIADFRPERKPLDNMVSALASQLGYDNINSFGIELSKGYSSLIELYKNSGKYIDIQSAEWKNTDEETQKKLKSNAANLLILVDQFEEFFTNSENYSRGVISDYAKIVVNLLIETNKIAIAEKLPVYIVCTMRTDYIGNCASFRGLAELIGRSHYFVPRLTSNELFQVIDEPAMLSGNVIAPRLVQRLLNDLGEGEGTDILPVLQHALYQIWRVAENDKSPVMDLLHYAKVGGLNSYDLPQEHQPIFQKWYNELPDYKIELLRNPSLENVLNTHANELYQTADTYFNTHSSDKITDKEAKKIIRTAFTCLTKIDESKEVRNRMSVKELTAMIGDKKIDSFVVVGVLNIFRAPGNTLIRPYIPNPAKSVLKDWSDMSITEETVFDITHEALIRNWKLLSEWAQKENEGANVFYELRKHIELWLINKKSKAYLLSAGQLTYFRNWYFTQNPTYAWVQRYIKESADKQIKSTVVLDKKTEELALNIKEYIDKSGVYINLKRKLSIAATITISVLLVISSIGFFLADKKKNEAVSAHNISKSNEIAMQAFLIQDADPTLAFRLGEAAYKIHKGTLAKQAIMSSYCAGPFYRLIKIDISSQLQFNSFSMDGKYILMIGRNEPPQIWDTKGNVICNLETNRENIALGEFSKDGNYIILVSLNNTIQFWKYNSEEKKWKFFSNYDLPVENIFSLCVSHNNKYLLISAEKNAHLFEFNEQESSFKKLMDFTGHSDYVINAQISPDDNYIVTSSHDKTAKIWSIKGKELKTLTGHSSTVNFADISNKGEFIVTTSIDNTARIYHKIIEKNKEDWIQTSIIDVHKGDVNKAIFHPNGKYFFTASEDNSVRMWDLNGFELLKFLGHSGPIEKIAISSEGNMLLSYAQGEGTLRIWNLEQKQVHLLKNHTQLIWNINFSPDGKFILTASDDNTAALFNFNTLESRILTKHSSDVDKAIFSHNGNFIFTCSSDKTAILWNMEGNEPLEFKGHLGRISDIDFSPDDKLIATASHDSTARIWDMNANELVVIDKHKDIVRQVAFSHNGKQIITSANDSTLRIWDTKGIEQVVIYNVQNFILSQFDLSPDGKNIAVIAADYSIIIYDFKGNKLKTLIGHKEPVIGIKYSPDGKYIVTTSHDNTARIWDVNTLQSKLLHGHTAFVNIASFSPDSKFIITPADDNTIRLWDIEGNELQVFKGHTKGVQVAKFSPDGQFIVSGSQDATVRIWPAHVEDILYNINEKKTRGYVRELSDDDKKVFDIK